MIILTEAAQVQLKKTIEGQPDFFIRVGIVGGGCSGFEYKLDLWPKEEGDDPAKYNKYDYEGFSVLVDKKAELYIYGTTYVCLYEYHATWIYTYLSLYIPLWNSVQRSK